MGFSLPKVFNKKNGAALVSVMIAFTVIMIFIAAIITLFQNNLLQSKRQENGIQAYYIARSGVDLAVSALTQQGTGGSNDTLLYKQFNKVLNHNISSTPTLTQTISFDNGSADITVRALDIGSERWIEIKSTGTLAGTNVQKTINLRFVVNNPSIQKWN